jgi:predicted phage terminase large subunit-like protein
MIDFLISTKEFLAEMADLARSVRQEIEAHAVGIDPSPSAIAERRKRVASGDFLFFVLTYFPHHLRNWRELPDGSRQHHDLSSFQQHFCRRFPALLEQQSGCREWWIAPRGEGKSSLLTKIGPVWCSVQQALAKAGERGPWPIDYLLLFGAETRMPTKLLEVIKTELTANSALALDFPEVCGRGPEWKVGSVITKSGLKIEPFGAEQAMRGTFYGSSRPRLLLGDDLITDTEAKSPAEREKRWDWLEKAVDYLGPPDGTVKFLSVGTVLNADDPISRAKRTIGHVVHHFRAIVEMPVNMHLWEKCEEMMRNADPAVLKAEGEAVEESKLPSYAYYIRHRRAMDKGAITSWPDVRSLYWLMRQRAKNARAFGTEMQGDERSDEDSVFTTWQHFVEVLAEWVWYGACDPSMGQHDPSAIVAGAWDRVAKRLYVADADRKKRVPSKLRADILAIQRKRGCAAWAFENNNAYEDMRRTTIQYALEKGVNLPLIGVTAVVSQDVRIESLEPEICDNLEPRILFHPSLSTLFDEMRSYPEIKSEHHYDLLTALHLLWMIAVSRGGMTKLPNLPSLPPVHLSGAIDLSGY